MSGRLPMDGPVWLCERLRMDGRDSTLPDVVQGARAAGSLLAGDLTEAEAELAHVRTRYLAGFLVRLAVVAPSVSLRLAWRVGVRRRLGVGVPLQ